MPWTLLLALACAPTDGSDGPDGDPATDDAVPAWDADRAGLAAGDAASWHLDLAPPDGFVLNGFEGDVGVIRPTAEQLWEVEPLDAPAVGHSAWYLDTNVTDRTDRFDPLQQIFIPVADAVDAGVTCDVAMALGQRLDLPLPDIAITLTTDAPAPTTVAVATATIVPPPVGAWTAASITWTAPAAVGPLWLVLEVRSGGDVARALLVDQLTVDCG
jgi:hypothetical protein